MKAIYGWVEHRSIPTMFGPQPPNVISIDTSHCTQVRVLEGRMGIPNIEDEECYLQTDSYGEGGFYNFRLVGYVRKKYESQVAAIVTKLKEIVANESIYRGKAIRVEADSDGNIDRNPRFMDLTHVVTPIFSKQVEVEIATSIYTPIRYTETVRDSGIPIKRGVLLEGPYGTGKTLTSYTTAQECVQNGWTFVAVSQACGLRQTLELARRYMPAVVFCEDIDRATTGSNRTVELDDILNTIDGLESKSTEIMVVLTSNHVENINKAMLRPGRLDAIIRVEAPDAEAVERLIRVYGGVGLAKDVKLDKIGEVLQGKIPAVIREVVERSKLYAIMLNDGGADYKLTEDALLAAAYPMQYHWSLMSENKDARSNADKVFDALGDALNERLVGGDGDNTIVRRLLHDIEGSSDAAAQYSSSADDRTAKILKAIVQAEGGAKTMASELKKTNQKIGEIHDIVV
jgi:transitional endoplasmic reticulum ATPase